MALNGKDIVNAIRKIYSEKAEGKPFQILTKSNGTREEIVAMYNMSVKNGANITTIEFNLNEGYSSEKISRTDRKNYKLEYVVNDMGNGKVKVTGMQVKRGYNVKSQLILAIDNQLENILNFEKKEFDKFRNSQEYVR